MAKAVKRLGYGNARQAATYTVDGVTDTLRGWAARIGCTYHALYKRICLQGRSPEDAIRAGGQALNRTRLTINGKTLHIAEWSRETGIDEGLISGRLQRGWSKEEAVGLKKHKNSRERTFTYRGKTRRMCEWARELNINYEVFRQRILRWEAGDIAYRTVFIPGLISVAGKSRPSKHQHWYKGKRLTIAAIAEKKGCGKTWVSKMLKAGYTATQIIDNPSLAPIRDNEEIARRQREAQGRNNRMRELKRLGLII